jgi:carboxypeptidase C (cathepsin A)
MFTAVIMPTLVLRLFAQQCDGPLCYREGAAIADYLNKPETRKLLGVTSPYNFTGCSSTVGQLFVSHMDKFAHPTQHYVSGLLERGVRMLIYAGTYDWQCNWVSNVMWTEALEWSGAAGYHAAEWRDWSIEDGNAAGQTKEFGGLTFVTLLGAGHMMSLSLLPTVSMLMCFVEDTYRSTSLRKVSPWCRGGWLKRRYNSYTISVLPIEDVARLMR